jgi:hypothetical protein
MKNSPKVSHQLFTVTMILRKQFAVYFSVDPQRDYLTECVLEAISTCCCLVILPSLNLNSLSLLKESPQFQSTHLEKVLVLLV